MEQKYFLDEADIRNLTEEQSRIYNRFIRTVKDKGAIDSADLESFDEILRQQYSNRTLYNPNSLERYPEILSKNLNSILNDITNVRNDIVKEKKPSTIYSFKDIHTSLEVLEKFIKKYLNSSHYKNSFDIMNLEQVLSRVEQLKSQVAQDLQFYQGYLKDKEAAYVDYSLKKDAYDKLSLFGRLVAKVNGKEKELSEARVKNNSYGMVKPVSTMPGDIDNPLKYEEYLKMNQLDDTIGRTR